MRVIAGAARGRPLAGPKTSATRPTSDLVREAMFSMIDNLNPDYERVLDLYAGTGALGIEALSRGATECDFIDDSRAACAVIRRNLELVGIAGGRVVCQPVAAGLSRVSGPYDLILIDPPYADTSLPLTIATVLGLDLLAPDGVLVAEHGKRTALPDTSGVLERVRERRHGDTIVSIYQLTDR